MFAKPFILSSIHILISFCIFFSHFHSSIIYLFRRKIYRYRKAATEIVSITDNDRYVIFILSHTCTNSYTYLWLCCFLLRLVVYRHSVLYLYTSPTKSTNLEFVRTNWSYIYEYIRVFTGYWVYKMRMNSEFVDFFGRYF